MKNFGEADNNGIKQLWKHKLNLCNHDTPEMIQSATSFVSHQDCLFHFIVTSIILLTFLALLGIVGSLQ